MNEPMTESDYDKQTKAIKKALKDMGDSSKVAKRLASAQEENKSKACRLAYKLLDESLEMYKGGDMKWDEMVKDLSNALDAVPDALKGDE